MAIKAAGLSVCLREVDLKNKPVELLQLSAKATVPVLWLSNAELIDESLAIMLWALKQADPLRLLSTSNIESHPFMQENDGEFKVHLDHYKYGDRYTGNSQLFYRGQCCIFLNKLEMQLTQAPYLSGNRLSLLDLAIFPFIRQCAFVDKSWFDSSQFVSVRQWLNQLLSDPLFMSVMSKYPVWKAKDDEQMFPS
jgi:glutathione S-transferase